ncbi:MAG: response regulator [Azonexus sp.]
MAIRTPFSDKSVLILDDLPEMRSTLRSQVGSLGCEQIAVSSNVKDSLEQLKAGKFDVILCDFYLAGGTDGQQFLEFLRSRRIIGRDVLFVMITAEKGYENVVTAAECLPDDYLLKPFTADTLKGRLERLLEKKDRLAKVDQMQNKGNWPGVIAACDEILAAKDRYYVDVLRIKGNALILSGQNEAAIEFYQQALAMRPLPWAKLGLAKAVHQSGDSGRSKQILQELIVESPKLMIAYDMLGSLHLAAGETDAAMTVLDGACLISPNSLARHRAIASVAEEMGDFSRVEQALELVVKKTRNSPLRETHDFARLGKALIEKGDPTKAVALLEEARTTFKSDAADPFLAAIEALAQHQVGNVEKANAALERAMQGERSKLPEASVMAMAKACLSLGRQDTAQEMLKHLVQSNPDSTALHERISTTLRDSGAHELAEQLVTDSIREIILLNNEAIKRAKSGELAAAAEMLTEAAQRLPGNLQIVANAAMSLLFDIYTNGLDATKLQTAQAFQQAVLARNPNYPKLAEIAELTGRIRNKYSAGKKQ